IRGPCPVGYREPKHATARHLPLGGSLAGTDVRRAGLRHSSGAHPLTRVDQVGDALGRPRKGAPRRCIRSAPVASAAVGAAGTTLSAPPKRLEPARRAGANRTFAVAEPGGAGGASRIVPRNAGAVAVDDASVAEGASAVRRAEL